MKSFCPSYILEISTFLLLSLVLPKHKKKNQLSLVLMKPIDNFLIMAGTTRLELATSCVTGKRSNQTELRPLSINLL